MRTAYVQYFVMLMLTLTQAQQEKSIVATMDCGLYESTTGSLSNGMGQYLFVGNIESDSGKNVRRALLKFDMENIIPLGAEITFVQLKVYGYNVTSSEVQRINLFRVTADWGEGISADMNIGQGAPSTSGDATWIHRFFDAVYWTSPGGDFSPEISSYTEIGSNGVFTFDPTTVLINDVQGWVNNPTTNFGWILLGNESVQSSAKAIDSRESLTEANRPTLIVQYDAPAGVHTIGEIPARFSLNQNFPNPFNPTTVIQYSIPISANVTLKVFDIVGREVAVLVDEIKDAGSYSYKWNAVGFPSGMYFYRLQSGTNITTKKLLLAK